MQILKTIPVLRIFDYQKAVGFYIDWLGFQISWLGFQISWEHVFEPGAPIYMEIEKDGASFHLSEHHGDATPGAKIFIWCSGLKAYHDILIAKKYKYNKPGIK